jgi:hypothetical protein
MEAHIRISVKDLPQNKNLKIQLARTPFARNRQLCDKMNGQPRPKNGRPVSLTRLLAALLRKSLVRTAEG